MVGSPGTPDMSNPLRKEKPKVTTFSCGKCGAPVAVRYPGHSLSAVCDHCFSVIDTSDDTFRVIHTYHKQMQVHPRIELGTRGELKGRTWEVIGFVVRADMGSSFKWQEYLLFNPYYGYRWLTCNNGHWSFVTMIKEQPDRGGTSAELNGKSYKLFFQGKASVFYVFGEFYWKVAVGEAVGMVDYILPPEMLSVEEDKHQRVWSVAEYLEPKVVKEAFKIDDDSIDTPVGVAPNQPSPASESWKKVAPVWLFFLIALTALQIVHCCLALNRLELVSPVTYTTKQEGVFNAGPNKSETYTTPPFILTKDNANVEITLNSGVDNSWLYVYGELVNDETDETFTFERTCEYYHGYDGGESWSEGSGRQSIFINNVPGGKYYLNLEVDNGGAVAAPERKTFTVSVKRDAYTFQNYLWCLFLISIYPLLSWFRKQHMEIQRWSDSDFSPYRSSSDD